MVKILEDERPTRCSCGSSFFKYSGLGEFICESCGKKHLNDYGKVRKYLEKHENALVSDVAEATGVSEENISALVSENKIVAMIDPRFKLYCKTCGCQILLGDYCDKCKLKREKEREGKIRSMLGEEVSQRKKFSGFSTNNNRLENGRIRFTGRRS